MFLQSFNYLLELKLNENTNDTGSHIPAVTDWWDQGTRRLPRWRGPSQKTRRHTGHATSPVNDRRWSAHDGAAVLVPPRTDYWVFSTPLDLLNTMV
jgi:hypothetical protein